MTTNPSRYRTDLPEIPARMFREYVPEAVIQNPLDLHWLAGWLEGEGSFVRPQKGRSNLPLISATNTDLDVIERVARLLMVKVYVARHQEQKGYKRLYTVSLRGFRAMSIMRQLYPLMGERRRGQIDAALATFNQERALLRGHYNRSTKLTEQQAKAIWDARTIARAAAGGKRHWGYDSLRRQLGERYGVSPAQIKEIWSGRSWSWVTGASPNMRYLRRAVTPLDLVPELRACEREPEEA